MRIPDDKAAKVLEASAYYDAVNFARKFKGKSLHGVGFTHAGMNELPNLLGRVHANG